METKTCEISNSRGIGYTGKHGERAYLACITGSDARYGLKREFLTPARVERDKFNSRKYTLTYHYEIEPGLYEEQSEGDRRIIMAWVCKGRTTWTSKITQERVAEIVRLLDAGQTFEAARLATRAATPSNSVAR